MRSGGETPESEAALSDNVKGTRNELNDQPIVILTRSFGNGLFRARPAARRRLVTRSRVTSHLLICLHLVSRARRGPRGASSIMPVAPG